MRKKIYVGCALTQAPLEFREEVERFKDSLREEFEILDFVGLEKGTNTDVYRHDIHVCIAQCDFFIAICDYPAIGLGYEMGVAIEKLGKPTLAVAREGTRVTRLALGVDASCYEFRYYADLSEIAAVVHARLAESAVA